MKIVFDILTLLWTSACTVTGKSSYVLPVRPGKKTELPHTGITTLSVNDRYQCEIEGKYTKAGDMTITDMPMSWEWVSNDYTCMYIICRALIAYTLRVHCNLTYRIKCSSHQSISLRHDMLDGKNEINCSNKT